jgi:hypothetical protein
MTYSLRRSTRLVVAAAAIAAPLWFVAGAEAASAVVTFSGSPVLTPPVSCPSQPDVVEVTVSPGATVNFVDALGVAASLTSSIGDQQKLGNGQEVPVTFTARATVQFTMTPDPSACPLNVTPAVAMTVHVTDPPASPAPSTPAASPASPSPTGAAGPSDSVKATPKGTRTATNRPKAKHDASPSPSASSGPPAVSGAGKGGDADPMTVSAVAGQPLMNFGDPVSTTRSPHAASGLLTLIATVSVGGVTAAVIRAIVAHRTTRSLIS